MKTGSRLSPGHQCPALRWVLRARGGETNWWPFQGPSLSLLLSRLCVSQHGRLAVVRDPKSPRPVLPASSPAACSRHPVLHAAPLQMHAS